jgi:hypothetical protein
VAVCLSLAEAMLPVELQVFAAVRAEWGNTKPKVVAAKIAVDIPTGPRNPFHPLRFILRLTAFPLIIKINS